MNGITNFDEILLNFDFILKPIGQWPIFQVSLKDLFTFATKLFNRLELWTIGSQFKSIIANKTQQL